MRALVPALAAAALAGPAAADRTVALVIGIDAYQNIPGLSGAVNDARDIAGALEALGAETTLLLNEEATREAILSTWTRLAGEVGPGDRLIVTYAGHGSNEIEAIAGEEEDGRDENWLLAGFSPFGEASGERIRDNEIAALIALSPEAEVIFLSDSCHSGTVSREIVPVLGYRYYRTDGTLADDPLPPPPPRPGEGGEFDAVALYLGAVPDAERVPEFLIGDVPRGALSWSFAEGLRGAADADGDGVVSAAELEAHVRARVREISRGLQRPQIAGAGEVAFALTPAAVPVGDGGGDGEDLPEAGETGGEEAPVADGPAGDGNAPDAGDGDPAEDPADPDADTGADLGSDPEADTGADPDAADDGGEIPDGDVPVDGPDPDAGDTGGPDAEAGQEQTPDGEVPVDRPDAGDGPDDGDPADDPAGPETDTAGGAEGQETADESEGQPDADNPPGTDPEGDVPESGDPGAGDIPDGETPGGEAPVAESGPAGEQPPDPFLLSFPALPEVTLSVAADTTLPAIDGARLLPAGMPADLVYDPATGEMRTMVGDLLTILPPAGDPAFAGRLQAAVDNARLARTLTVLGRGAAHGVGFAEGDGTYRDGDRVTVRVEGRQTAHVALFSLSPEGSIVPLYPLHYPPAGLDDPAETDPADALDLGLRVAAPFGSDFLIAVETAAPSAALGMLLSDPTRTWPARALWEALQMASFEGSAPSVAIFPFHSRGP